MPNSTKAMYVLRYRASEKIQTMRDEYPSIFEGFCPFSRYFLVANLFAVLLILPVLFNLVSSLLLLMHKKETEHRVIQIISIN
jgi:hypothetical protein